MIKKISKVKDIIFSEGMGGKVIRNSGWLIADKILRLFLNIFIVSIIARYLGPTEYGLLNYSLAFVGVFGAFASLGLDSIVVKELLENRHHKDSVLGTTFWMKLAGGFFVTIFSLIVIIIKEPDNFNLIVLVLLNGISFVFQSIDTIDYYFQSKMKSKYIVISKSVAFITISVVRIVMVYYEASLLLIGSTFTIEFFLYGIGYVWYFKIGEVYKWKFTLSIAKYLLTKSWPLIISGLAIMLYMKIDQIMLREMKGDEVTGIYSAALKLSEIWYFVPMSIVTSFFPAIVQAKNESAELYNSRFQKLLNILSVISIFVAVFMTFFSSIIVEIIFGNQYLLAAEVLKIHIWTGIFVAMGIAGNSWLITENLIKNSLYRTVAGCSLNIILNYILIPQFSIYGAALATLASYFFITFIFDIFDKRTLPCFYSKARSFNLIQNIIDLLLRKV